jgi:saposin
MLALLLSFSASVNRRPRVLPSKERPQPPSLRLHSSPNTLACEVCKQIIVYIEQLLVAGVVESEIESLVDQLCEQLPPPLNTFCVTTVNQYIDNIIQWINEGITELDICKSLGFCETTKAVKGVPCDICKQVVERIIQLLLEGQVEKDIIEELNAMCDEYGGVLASYCKSFVDTTVDDIIKFYEAGLDPQEICAKIGLCDPDSRRK